MLIDSYERLLMIEFSNFTDCLEEKVVCEHNSTTHRPTKGQEYQ